MSDSEGGDTTSGRRLGTDVRPGRESPQGVGGAGLLWCKPRWMENKAIP